MLIINQAQRAKFRGAIFELNFSANFCASICKVNLLLVANCSYLNLARYFPHSSRGHFPHPRRTKLSSRTTVGTLASGPVTIMCHLPISTALSSAARLMAGLSRPERYRFVSGSSPSSRSFLISPTS